ncbi:MAG: sugar ABC transporter substrate-binding protein [Sphaerochaetaceae bacterium]|jgi:ribose transport system substrate-binding protein|nr:sugar ABC transporter substrate-binding protein [Sphaerochaetaceae bacterium]NLV85231.1 sugar ABC transporter substrate-binding protein [Spirochaetales bacterium]
MKKLLLVFVIAMVAITTVFAAGAQEVETGKKVFTVGINNFGQANFFARIGRESMIDQIEKNGGKVISTVTADVPSRIAAIENMISQGVDAIIIEEGDINQVAPPLIEAKKQGIIIGSMDAGDADFVDVFVESDNDQLGRASAEALMKAIGYKGKIVEIFNDAGSMIRVRKNALHEVVAKYPDVTIEWGFVYAWPDYLSDVKAKMEALIQAHPEKGAIAGVFATFDGAGLGAAQAIWEAGLQDTIKITGVDGDPEAYKEMRKPGSPFVATLAQDPETIARTVVDRVFDLLNGKKLEDRHIYIPGILITQDNIPAL